MAMAVSSSGSSEVCVVSEPGAYVWQDREIRFDLPIKQLNLRKGEVLIDSINSVEDTKGNNGERGQLEITNLRLLWAFHKNNHTNLSIGYNCIQNIQIKMIQSRLRGNTQALFIMTKFGTTRFEFIFTSLVKSSPRLFTTIQSLYRSYETSKLYRDLKLRGAIIKDKQLVALPREEMYRTLTGIWNLSSEQGNLGTFFITNVRIVWFANLAENFNVSIPYIQIQALRLRNSKFGRALVLETTTQSGGYTLGFRVDPESTLHDIYKEITSLYTIFSQTPIFGIEGAMEEKPTSVLEKQVRKADDIDIVQNEDTAAMVDSFAVYYAAKNKQFDKEITYSNELGCAVESLPQGIGIEDLWYVK